jgi:hypothetical protein
MKYKNLEYYRYQSVLFWYIEDPDYADYHFRDIEYRRRSKSK